MKRKLLLICVALLCAVGTWAQASFNHIYTEGVTASAGSNYFLYNIGSGMFLTDGMDYGTHASVDHGGRILTLANNTNGFSIYTQPYSANGSDEKNGYLTTNGYIDTGTNDADWVFTPVSVAGYTNAYTIKNSESQYLYWECKEKLYQDKVGQFINVGASTNDNYSYWLLIPLTTRQAANDYTYLLRNTEFQHPWELVMWSNTATWTNYCGGNKENTCAEMISSAFDVSQTISVSVSNGKYIIYNQGFYRNDDATKPAYLYANADTKVMRILNSESEGTAADMSGASTSFSAGKYVNSVSTIVKTNSLKVGVKTEGTNWTIFDNFYLEYLGNGLAVVYEPADFTSGGSASADTWYAFTVPDDGLYTVTPSAAGIFSYTQNGNQAFDGTFTSFYAPTTGRLQYLTAGTFYFKTNTTANVTIAAQSVKAGADFTAFIDDPSFERLSLTSSSNVSTDLLNWVGTDNTGTAYISHKDKQTRSFSGVDGNNLFETWKNNSGFTDYYLKQTLHNLPVGLYRLTCKVASDNTNTVTVEFGASSQNAACTGKTNGISTTVDLNNTSVGDVLIHLHSTKWFKVDDFRLQLVANLIEKDAVELPAGGTMAADAWYYFPAGADDKWIDAPIPGNIVFTTDGSQLTNIAGTALSEMTMTSGTKYYIKSSSAQTVTVSEQTIANGTYYLYSPYTGLFLGSGANYGTSAFADKYGVPFDLELHADGYMLKFVDWNKYLYGPNWLYVDGDNGAKFKIAESTVGDYTGYALFNKAETSNNRLYVYLKENGDKYRVAGNAIIGDNCENEAQTVWQLKSVAEHNTVVNAYPTDNINHVIAAAGMEDKTDAAGFESYLSTYYDANDMTDKIGTAKFGGGAGDWTWTQVENRSGSDGYRYETAWQYQRTGSYTQTIAAANLPAGVYKVEMGGFDRHASEASDISLASSYGSLSSSYLKANDEQVRMKAWADVEGRPTTGETQANSINSGAADNVVYVYLDGSTDLNLKVCKPAYLEVCYFNFGNFRLTRYTLKDADETDYTALNTAIAAAETHTLGFESGEYAPYNNIERLSELANAKAIDQDADNTKEMVNASTNALNDGAWTANVGDVECVYNGDFANGQGSPAANIQDYGWTRTNAWGSFQGDSDKSSTSNGTSYYNQPGSLQYGNAGYYTMPLKANTIYQLTFKYASWEANSNNWVKASVLKSGEGMAAVKYEKNATVHTTAGAFVAKTILFVTTTAGDYVLTLNNDGNTVITDVSIRKAANQYLEFADGSVPNYAPGRYPSVKITRTLTAGRWATAVYPFAVPKSSDLAIATISEYDKETGELTFDAPDASTANTPFLMRSTAGATEISLSDVTVAAASVTNATANEAHLIGTYSATDITNAEKNYVLSNNVIYPVGDAGATIPAYRAYFQIDQDTQDSEVKALTLVFDDADAIGSIVNSQEPMAESQIYNLAGQRLSKAQKGVNIINGKKVLVK